VYIGLVIELFIIGICSLPVASTVAIFTPSRNISRLNWNRLKCVSCDSRHNTAKACAYSRPANIAKYEIVRFGSKNSKKS